MHSVGYYFKNENNESESWYASNRGINCIDWFLSELVKIANIIFDFLDVKKPMKPLTEEEKNDFHSAVFCHICKKSLIERAFIEKLGIRVRDHCHITGLFRGAAHQGCNLTYKISRSIPIVMHNLSGYDSHLLIKKLATSTKLPGEITIIPHNSENYISFIKTMRCIGQTANPNKKYGHEIKFKFIDSLRFMKSSLDTLASNLQCEQKRILKSECEKSGFCSDKFSLLNRKGVFLYEYIDKYAKLEESMLPPKEMFYSTLRDAHISETDYVHAQNVWNKFNVRTLGEYSDLYLKTDVLLLADVFENFRAMCYDTYALDPAHYFSAPGLSFDAMLKCTGVSIELFTDVDMLMFTERGIRGGVSQINKRYVKANNFRMGDEFDPSKESSYIMYLDGKHIYIYTIHILFLVISNIHCFVIFFFFR